MITIYQDFLQFITKICSSFVCYLCQALTSQSMTWSQFRMVTQSCLTLWPHDCSMLGLPVHHQLPEPTQTHVYHISNAIRPSLPLSSPSPPAFNLSQHQGLYKWVSFLHQEAVVGVLASASVLPMNIQDRFPLGSNGLITLQSKGLSRVFSNTTS